MIDGDIIIFVRDDGATRSFKRENGSWSNENPCMGFPSDEDIKALQDQGRLFILLRGGFIVKTNLTAVRQTVTV